MIIDMTRLMEQAIDRLRSVPESEQDRLAQFVLSEIEEESRWVRSTATNEAKLKGLVDRVLVDDAGGGCNVLEPDQL
jgi:hypothetical protein